VHVAQPLAAERRAWETIEERSHLAQDVRVNP
jgi:hypothetical protein